MDDFVARRDLLPAEQLAALSERADVRGLIYLGGHAGALCVTGALVLATLHTWWLVPAWLAHGLLLNFLFAPLHETIHRTAFKSRWLNDLVAQVAGAVLILPPGYFRHFHFGHHRDTQIAGRDPELLAPKPTTIGSYLWYMSSLQSYWWTGISLRIRHALGYADEPFIPDRARGDVIREARLLLSFYAAVAVVSLWFEWWAPVTLWLAPMVLAAPSLRLFLHAEHSGCEMHEDMIRNTRTIATNSLMRALAWNMPYHVEHHLFPGVPFHALPEVFARIRGRHRYLIAGYSAHHRDTIRALRESRRSV